MRQGGVLLFIVEILNEAISVHDTGKSDIKPDTHQRSEFYFPYFPYFTN